MPIYEYECTQCHTRFERRQSWTEAPVQTCPECTGKVRRVYYPVGIVFKGSGFYITDNRKNGSTMVGSEPTESKPATPAPTKSEGSSTAQESTATATAGSSAAKTESKVATA